MPEYNNPVLSVIVAVGDYERFLKNYLNYVESEAVDQIEFIFIVNTWNKIDLVREFFIDSVLNYKIICGLYDNPGAARNAGLEVCEGRWVTFHDVDDHPFIGNILDLTCMAIAGEYEIGCGRFMSSSFQYNEPLNTFRWTKKKFADVARRPGIWRMVFQREILIDQKFLFLSMGEDQHYLMQIGFAGKRILFSNLMVYNYKLGVPNQLTGNKKKLLDLIAVQESERELLKKIANREELYFATNLMLRQSITLLKHSFALANFFKSSYCILKSLANSNYLFRNQARQARREREILVFLTGGLGNQMFQISAALSVAKGRIIRVLPWGRPSSMLGIPESAKIVWPANVVFDRPRRGNIDRVVGYLMRKGLDGEASSINLMFLSLKAILIVYLFLLGHGLAKIHVSTGVGYDPIETCTRNLLLIGYFQSHLFSDNWVDKFKISFIDHGEILEFGSSQIEDKIAIHIRLGDYLDEENFGVLDENYYIRAIGLIPAGGAIAIDLFTNSPELVRSYFPNLPWAKIDIQFSKEESSLSVLNNMSKYKFLVVGNSTFSWWAGYLSNKTKVVVYPSPWFQGLVTPNKLCPGEWISCKATFRNRVPRLENGE